jgi:hypothetical protein
LTQRNGGPYPDAVWLAAEVADINRQLIEHLLSVDAYDEEEDNRDPWIDAVAAEVGDPLQQEHASSYPAAWIPETQPLLLLPTVIPWHIPAIMLFEPGNSGIAPDEHVCLLKRWAELYGAEPFEISGASLAMRAVRPPPDCDTARALAWEHITYCEDIDFRMLESRAVELYRGAAWSFWWD